MLLRHGLARAGVAVTVLPASPKKNPPPNPLPPPPRPNQKNAPTPPPPKRTAATPQKKGGKKKKRKKKKKKKKKGKKKNKKKKKKENTQNKPPPHNPPTFILRGRERHPYQFAPRPAGLDGGAQARRKRRALLVATNNVLNPFTPFGDASLLRMANFSPMSRTLLSRNSTPASIW